jgi:hypothetical protein
MPGIPLGRRTAHSKPPYPGAPTSPRPEPCSAATQTPGERLLGNPTRAVHGSETLGTQAVSLEPRMGMTSHGPRSPFKAPKRDKGCGTENPEPVPPRDAGNPSQSGAGDLLLNPPGVPNRVSSGGAQLEHTGRGISSDMMVLPPANGTQTDHMGPHGCVVGCTASQEGTAHAESAREDGDSALGSGTQLASPQQGLAPQITDHMGGVLPLPGPGINQPHNASSAQGVNPSSETLVVGHPVLMLPYYPSAIPFYPPSVGPLLLLQNPRGGVASISLNTQVQDPVLARQVGRQSLPSHPAQTAGRHQVQNPNPLIEGAGQGSVVWPNDGADRHRLHNPMAATQLPAENVRDQPYDGVDRQTAEAPRVDGPGGGVKLGHLVFSDTLTATSGKSANPTPVEKRRGDPRAAIAAAADPNRGMAQAQSPTTEPTVEPNPALVARGEALITPVETGLPVLSPGEPNSAPHPGSGLMDPGSRLGVRRTAVPQIPGEQHQINPTLMKATPAGDASNAPLPQAVSASANPDVGQPGAARPKGLGTCAFATPEGLARLISAIAKDLVRDARPKSAQTLIQEPTPGTQKAPMLPDCTQTLHGARAGHKPLRLPSIVQSAQVQGPRGPPDSTPRSLQKRKHDWDALHGTDQSAHPCHEPQTLKPPAAKPRSATIANPSHDACAHNPPSLALPGRDEGPMAGHTDAGRAWESGGDLGSARGREGTREAGVRGHQDGASASQQKPQGLLRARGGESPCASRRQGGKAPRVSLGGDRSNCLQEGAACIPEGIVPVPPGTNELVNMNTLCESNYGPLILLP